METLDLQAGSLSHFQAEPRRMTLLHLKGSWADYWAMALFTPDAILFLLSTVCVLTTQGYSQQTDIVLSHCFTSWNEVAQSVTM